MVNNRFIALGFFLTCLGHLAAIGCDEVAHTHVDAGEPLHNAAYTDTGEVVHAHQAEPDHDHDILHVSHDPQAACQCDAARLVNGWCPRCDVGYIATIPIESSQLFTTLDPHGHDLDLGQIACEDCRAAIGDNGFCDPCGMGFVRGNAYFSRLTHGLATGRTVDVKSLACADCQANAANLVWCERCSRGIIGVTAIYNKEIFVRTSQEYRTLLAAVEKVEECELCACAMAVHRTCPICFISYEPGSPGEPERNPEYKTHPVTPST